MAPSVETTGYYHLDQKLDSTRTEMARMIEEVRNELGGKIDKVVVQLLSISVAQGKSSGRGELVRWILPLLLTAAQIIIMVKSGGKW